MSTTSTYRLESHSQEVIAKMYVAMQAAITELGVTGVAVAKEKETAIKTGNLNNSIRVMSTADNELNYGSDVPYSLYIEKRIHYMRQSFEYLTTIMPEIYERYMG